MGSEMCIRDRKWTNDSLPTRWLDAESHDTVPNPPALQSAGWLYPRGHVALAADSVVRRRFGHPADRENLCRALVWGLFTIRWAVCPPRHIALLAIPRMDVTFEYDGASNEQSYQTQRRFDMEIQRGGG